jgi:hypothetical protein
MLKSTEDAHAFNMSTFVGDEHLQGFDDGRWFHDEASFAQLQPKCDTRRIGENPATVDASRVSSAG